MIIVQYSKGAESLRTEIDLSVLTSPTVGSVRKLFDIKSQYAYVGWGPDPTVMDDSFVLEDGDIAVEFYD